MRFCNRIRYGTLAALLVLGALAAPVAQAGPIFDYVSTVNAANAPTLPLNPPGFGSAIVAIGNGNSLTFTTNNATGIDGSLNGGADINFGNIIFNAGGNNTQTPYGVNFNYEVTITDQESGLSGTVNFTGLVSGTARGNPRAINSAISNYVNTPSELILGTSKYLIGVTTVIGPGSFFDGVLQGNIRVVPVPEPSTILLGLVGVAGLAVVGLRKKNRGC
jgi:hypothetical protein